MSPAGWNRNRLTAQLGIEYPIIQGPLSGLVSHRLTAAVSNFGGLGSLGAHSLEAPAIRDAIGAIRALTTKPFAVNLWVSTEDDGARTSDEHAFDRSLSSLAPWLAEMGAQRPVYKPFQGKRFEDQARVLFDEKVTVFSFIFGLPPAEILQECRANEITTIGTATTVEEARLLEENGVDAIVASGFEAGGHRGSFLEPAEDSFTGTFSLVPQISDSIRTPVIAAGGIGDARGVIAALALGAEGIQMGTAFLGSEESGASALHRNALLAGNVRTSLTRGFTGRLARGLKNRLMLELERPGVEILPYPLQRALVRGISGPAESMGLPDLIPMWAGQSANLPKFLDATTFLSSLVVEVSEIAESIVQWTEGRRQKSPRTT